MNKRDLKKIIKPIVKECISEVILSEGLLASIISEVVTGLQPRQNLNDSKIVAPIEHPRHEEEMGKLQETRERMMDAIGKDAYRGINLFEGTTPVRGAGPPTPSAASHNPLASVDPKDPGVDISAVFGHMSSKWGKIAKGNQDG